MTLFTLLLVAALVLTLVHASGKAPLWPAVFVMLVALLINAWR